MSTSNGEDAKASVFNSSYVSREIDSNTTGKLDLENTSDAASGASITNIQREFNSLASFLGKAINLAKDVKPTWTNNQYGTPTDDVKTRADTLTDELNTLDDKTVDGPASSTDNAIARFNLATGKLVQDSGVIIDDSNNVTGVNDLTVNGDLNVQGDTTTFNTATVDVEDARINLNKNGTEATADAQDAGFNVEMSDATNAGIGFDSTLASKFKVGEVGSEKEVMSVSDIQVMTLKDIDGGTMSDTNRLTLPKGTTAQLDALADKEGTIAYDTDLDAIVKNDGAGWSESGGGGGVSIIASAYRTFDQAITSGGGGTVVNFNGEDIDTDSAFDIATNVGRFTAPAAGKYLVSYSLQILLFGSAASQLDAWIYINNTGTLWAHTINNDLRANGKHQIANSMILDLALNDYLEVNMIATGNNVNVKGSGADRLSHFDITSL